MNIQSLSNYIFLKLGDLTCSCVSIHCNVFNINSLKPLKQFIFVSSGLLLSCKHLELILITCCYCCSHCYCSPYKHLRPASTVSATQKSSDLQVWVPICAFPGCGLRTQWGEGSRLGEVHGNTRSVYTIWHTNGVMGLVPDLTALAPDDCLSMKSQAKGQIHGTV